MNKSHGNVPSIRLITFFLPALFLFPAITKSFAFEPSFQPHAFQSDGPRAVHLADVDNDGVLDLIVASENNDEIAWHRNNGAFSPSFTKMIVTSDPDGDGNDEGFADGACSVFAADLDRDGHLDLLSASENNNRIAWYKNTGNSPPSFFLYSISDSSLGAICVTAEDIDSDGDCDVLAASNQDHTIAWYENDGSSLPQFMGHTVTSQSLGVTSIVSGDLDGDNDPDILAASFQNDTVAWYENDGQPQPTFQEHILSQSIESPKSVTIEDLDSDGDLDAIITFYWGNKIAWYENQGGSPPVFHERVINDHSINPNSVFAIDFDSDQDIDVISDSSQLGKIAWYENTGAHPPRFIEHIVDSSFGPGTSITAADINNDCHVELISASYLNNKTGWYRTDYNGLLQILQPTPNFYTQADSIDVQAKLGDTHLVSIAAINGEECPIDSNGNFSATLPLQEGENIIYATASQYAGCLLDSCTEIVIRDTVPPVLTVYSPWPGMAIDNSIVIMRGFIEDTSPVSLYIGGSHYAYPGTSQFAEHVILDSNQKSPIVFIAEDAAGNQTTVSVPVIYESRTRLLYDDGNTVADRIKTQSGPATNLVRFSVPSTLTGSAFQVERITWYAGDGPAVNPKAVVRGSLGSYGLASNCIVEDITAVNPLCLNDVNLQGNANKFYVAPGDDFFAGIFADQVSIGRDTSTKEFTVHNHQWFTPSAPAGWDQRDYQLNSEGTKGPQDLKKFEWLGYYSTGSPGSWFTFIDYWKYIGYDWMIRATLAGSMSPELGCVVGPTPTPVCKPADLDCNQVVDAWDLLELIGAMRARNGEADITEDTNIDYQDIFEFGCWWDYQQSE